MESHTTDSKSFSWVDVEWDVLRRLRARFLQFDQGDSDDSDSGKAAAPAAEPDRTDYWRYPVELENYDFTFGERIGWKWDTVLAELKMRGWTPPMGTLLDWGCGTGVAGRRVFEAWPESVRKFLLWDRSGAARNFAVNRARAIFRDARAESKEMETVPNLLVISHVINELTPEALDRLMILIKKSEAVLWVEPGTYAVSRKLISVREKLLPHFRAIAPCTHALACGMLTPGNERHWCHHFAKIPGYIHTDPGWGRFSMMLDIDISTLPFSFLVLDKRPGALPEPETSRVIGEPRHFKGFAKILSCQADGVRELLLQKRDAPELLKAMKKDPGTLYHWQRNEDKITGGERLI